MLLLSNFSNCQPHPLWFLVVFQKLPLPGLANRIQLECEFGQLLVTGKISAQAWGKECSNYELMGKANVTHGPPPA